MTKTRLFMTAALTAGLLTQACADDSNQDTKATLSSKNVASAPLYGAELYSHNTVHFGRFDIRMRMVSEPGVVSSFFTYDNQSWQGEGRPWREIDFETIGSHPNLLQSNLITGDASNRVHSEKTTEVADIEAFQNYRLEWTPDAIRWYVNGQLIREDLAASSEQVRDMADMGQTYRSNIWISEVIEWVGRFDETQLPLYQVIDWIEYSELQDDGNYAVAWRDDFDSFDNSRWGKGNWGFDTNMVTFAPENIQIVDGELVLALTLAKKGVDISHYQAQQQD